MGFYSLEDFLGPQTLEVGADRVQALKSGLYAQRAKQILGAHFVKVQGDTGDVFSRLGLELVLSLGDSRTLG